MRGALEICVFQLHSNCTSFNVRVKLPTSRGKAQDISSAQEAMQQLPWPLLLKQLQGQQHGPSPRGLALPWWFFRGCHGFSAKPRDLRLLSKISRQLVPCRAQKCIGQPYSFCFFPFWREEHPKKDPRNACIIHSCAFQRNHSLCGTASLSMTMFTPWQHFHLKKLSAGQKKKRPRNDHCKT